MAKLSKTEVRDFIEALGGPAALSRELGVHLTVVAYWRQKGTIPRWRWRDLDTLATLKGIKLPKAMEVAA